MRRISQQVLTGALKQGLFLQAVEPAILGHEGGHPLKATCCRDGAASLGHEGGHPLKATRCRDGAGPGTTVTICVSYFMAGGPG